MESLQEIGIREFRNNMAKVMMATHPLAVTKHGETVGYYIPARPSSKQAEILALKQAAEQFNALLEEKGITEDDIVAEFSQARNKKENH